jgi:predicted nucleic acid-binding protein
MKIIIDTNIVFSVLLNTSSRVGDLLLNSDTVFEFYTCNLLKEEIVNHQDKLLKISGYTENHFATLCHIVFGKIKFISEDIIPFVYWHSALPIVRDVDIDDIAFVALNDLLGAKLWTGDKKLLEGIRAKGYANALSTEELSNLRNLLDNKDIDI